MKTKHGEYIPLVWDCGNPDAYYIRGHIDEQEALGVLEDEGEMLDGKLESGNAIGKARHVYARWSMQGDAPQGCTSVLREYNNPGRGRFKVTAFNVGCFAERA